MDANIRLSQSSVKRRAHRVQRETGKGHRYSLAGLSCLSAKGRMNSELCLNVKTRRPAERSAQHWAPFTTNSSVQNPLPRAPTLFYLDMSI